MKEISPKKYVNIQPSGNFKALAKGINDFIFWRDQSSKDLNEYFENTWIMDSRLMYDNAKKCCEDKGVDLEVDTALHMVIGARLEG